MGNLERKSKVLEDSWEDKMDQLGGFETKEDATNIQQLFHNNNVEAIKTQGRMKED